jgi:hypothetical protein
MPIKINKSSSNGKVIFSPQLANYLLRCGHDIQKIKIKRDSEIGEVVFVFPYTEQLFNDIDNWKSLRCFDDFE